MMTQAISRAALSLAFFGFTTGAVMAQPFAYVANGGSNNVSGYSVDSVTGALKPLTGSPFPTGTEPISVKATPSGKFVYVTNYYDNTISGFSLNGMNGNLTPILGSPFPTGSYPYTLTISPNGKFLYTADDNYGGTGIPGVSGFAIDGATGSLTPVSGSPFGAGTEPVSLAFTPLGNYLYVSDAGTGNVFAFAVNSDGSLTPVPGSPYAAGSYPFGLAVSPPGKFLYVPNTDSGDISAYRINGTTGALTPIKGSPFASPSQPAAVAVTPLGQFLYASEGRSNDVSGFAINETTGALTAVQGSPFPAGNEALNVTVSSSGQFVYVADAYSGQVSGYSTDASTGVLMPITGSPFIAGSYPASVGLANPAVKTCGALDVSREATLAKGPYTHQPKTDRWNETLTITNGVTPIVGPLSVVLLGLPSSTTTLYGTYPGLTTTYCFSSAGNYVVPIDALLPPGNNDTLLPGEVLSVPFVFQATQGGVPVKPTGYKPQLISGTLNK